MDLLKLKFLQPLAPYAHVILRVALGFGMTMHGWQKMFEFTPAGVAGSVMKGMPAPLVMAWIVTIVELVGGICVMLGILPRLWAFLFAIIMLVATFKMHLGQMMGGDLTAAVKTVTMFAMALYIATNGGGKPALGSMIGLSDDD